MAMESPSFAWLLVSIWCKTHRVQISNTLLSPAALRAMRTLRFISFLKGLQVLVTALIETFRNSVLYLLLLLLIIMFLFGIMGYYFFGFDEKGDRENWGTLGTAFFSLFTYVTVSLQLPYFPLCHNHSVCCGWRRQMDGPNFKMNSALTDSVAANSSPLHFSFSDTSYSPTSSSESS